MPQDQHCLPQDIQLLERGWLSSNNILFLTPTDGTVVDTGYASHALQTGDLICSALDGRTLTKIINTHLHSDHCGGNAHLQSLWPDVKTLIPPGQIQAVQAWDTLALSYEPTGQRCPAFQFDQALQAGLKVDAGQRQLTVYAAPGHDPHAVLLFEPELRLLLSADALWENGFGVVFPELEGESGFDEVKETLDLIESLQAQMVIPGHGPAFGDVNGALQRARSRLAKFQAEPTFHARYAAKVLLKFRLLETQKETLDNLKQWTERTPYFKLLHERFFNTTSPASWFTELVEELSRAKALTVNGDTVFNT